MFHIIWQFGQKSKFQYPNFVQKKIKKYVPQIRKNPESFWIGYRADKKKKSFVTSNLEKVGFSDWIPYTPDNYAKFGEWCVEMRDFGKNATDKVTESIW